MYLLDTCVISDLLSKRPTPGVVAWVDAVEEERLFISVITIGEIKRGVDRLPAARRRGELEAWLEIELPERFRGRILPIGVEVMLIWGQLNAELELNGKKMPAIDSIIAATARHHRCLLVTRNVKDFKEAGIELINPWGAPPSARRHQRV